MPLFHRRCGWATQQLWFISYVNWHEVTNDITVQNNDPVQNINSS